MNARKHADPAGCADARTAVPRMAIGIKDSVLAERTVAAIRDAKTIPSDKQIHEALTQPARNAPSSRDALTNPMSEAQRSAISDALTFLIEHKLPWTASNVKLLLAKSGVEMPLFYVPSLFAAAALGRLCDAATQETIASIKDGPMDNPTYRGYLEQLIGNADKSIYSLISSASRAGQASDVPQQLVAKANAGLEVLRHLAGRDPDFETVEKFVHSTKVQ
ncbi:Uncharacterised protein [Candidatus Anstonella stagnisolia]|nr:Uncharacterised protein [Candidatus Anstonella stagnisolia]